MSDPSDFSGQPNILHDKDNKQQKQRDVGYFSRSAGQK